MKKQLLVAGILLCLLPSVSFGEPEVIKAIRVPNPSGDFYGAGSWHVYCIKSDFSDEKACIIHAQVGENAHELSDFTVIVEEDKILAMVGTEYKQFPGKEQSLRIDDGQIWSVLDDKYFDLSGNEQHIYRALLSGSRARARWYSLPTGAPKTEVFSLFGLEKAIEKAKTILEGKLIYNIPEAKLELSIKSTLFGGTLSRLYACKQKAKVKEYGQTAAHYINVYPELLPVYQKSLKEAFSSQLSPSLRSAGALDCDQEDKEAQKMIQDIIDLIGAILK